MVALTQKDMEKQTRNDGPQILGFLTRPRKSQATIEPETSRNPSLWLVPSCLLVELIFERCVGTAGLAG